MCMHLIYRLLKISWPAQYCNSAEFPTLNRISVTVRLWRRRRDRQGRERAALQWVFHLYASEWLRGVLLRDKDWPLRPLRTKQRAWHCMLQQQYHSRSTVLYNTTVTDRMLLTPRAGFSSAGFVPSHTALNHNYSNNTLFSHYELCWELHVLNGLC